MFLFLANRGGCDHAYIKSVDRHADIDTGSLLTYMHDKNN